MNSRITAQLQGGQIYSTVYAADFSQQSSAGTADIVRKVTSTLASDPTHCFYLEGYSQGAAATVNALERLTGNAFDAVKGVFLIGNPEHKSGLACNVDTNGGTTTKFVNGLSAFGDLAYPADFSHFAYADPDAPKAGNFSLIGWGGVTTFNSLNNYILKGDDRFRIAKLQTQTALHETDSKWDFVVADWNGDGKPDLVAIKKSETATKCTEVHVLSGASSFKEFSLRAETPLFKSHGLFEFAVADWTRNGKPDLIAFKKKRTATNNTEVHVMSQLV